MYTYIYIICISILFCRTLEVKLGYAVSTGARYGCHAVSTYARIGCYGDHGVGVGVGRVSCWGVSPCHWDKRSIMKYLSSVDSVDIWFEVGLWGFNKLEWHHCKKFQKPQAKTRSMQPCGTGATYLYIDSRHNKMRWVKSFSAKLRFQGHKSVVTPTTTQA
jgi:hypothetical protein